MRWPMPSKGALNTTGSREQIENLHPALEGICAPTQKEPRPGSASRAISSRQHTARGNRGSYFTKSRYPRHFSNVRKPISESAEWPIFLSACWVMFLIMRCSGRATAKNAMSGPPRAAVLVTTSQWDKKTNSGLIAVVDNGPGFDISPTRAVEAFFTTRPGGMGLGPTSISPIW